eukprot:189461_1
MSGSRFEAPTQAVDVASSLRYANNIRIIQDLESLSEKLKSEPTAIRIQWGDWIDNWIHTLRSTQYLVTRPLLYHTLRTTRGFASWGYNNIADAYYDFVDKEQWIENCIKLIEEHVQKSRNLKADALQVLKSVGGKSNKNGKNKKKKKKETTKAKAPRVILTKAVLLGWNKISFCETAGGRYLIAAACLHYAFNYYNLFSGFGLVESDFITHSMINKFGPKVFGKWKRTSPSDSYTRYLASGKSREFMDSRLKKHCMELLDENEKQAAIDFLSHCVDKPVNDAEKETAEETSTNSYGPSRGTNYNHKPSQPF